MNAQWGKLAGIVFVTVLLVTGCGESATPVAPTSAPAVVIEASATPEPTPVPPTPTLIPPTPTAVPPTATPVPPTATAVPITEAPAESIDDVVGTWQGRWSDITVLNMKLDKFGGMWLYTTNNDTIQRDRFAFEDGLLVWKVAGAGTSASEKCRADPVATYEVTVLREDTRRVGLHFALIGPDNCVDRQEFLDGNTLKLVEP